MFLSLFFYISEMMASLGNFETHNFKTHNFKTHNFKTHNFGTLDFEIFNMSQNPRFSSTSDAHLLRRSQYMFVTISKLTTFMILNRSCTGKKMNNNLNQQILRGAAGISMNTYMFSDAYIFYSKPHRHVFFSVMMFNPFPHNDTFRRPWVTSLWKTLGKGEIAHNEQFLLFPQCFLPVRITCCHFLQI